MAVFLLVDTSIFGATVGLFGGDNAGVIDIVSSDGIADSARLLPSLVDRILERNHIALSALSGLIVSRGPGSFTGIRVGIAYALGLFEGLSGQKSRGRIAGLSSLGCIAETEARARGQRVAVFLSSTKTTGYVAVSDGTRAELKAVDCATIRVSMPDVFSGGLQWIVIGGWGELVATRAEMDTVVPPEVMTFPDAVRRGITAMGRIAAGWGQDQWSENARMDAIYLRKSSVEEKASTRV
jgi:tRNA threonylcarbamoyl adenosine modification protein YeaZ